MSTWEKVFYMRKSVVLDIPEHHTKIETKWLWNIVNSIISMKVTNGQLSDLVKCVSMKWSHMWNVFIVSITSFCNIEFRRCVSCTYLSQGTGTAPSVTKRTTWWGLGVGGGGMGREYECYSDTYRAKGYNSFVTVDKTKAARIILLLNVISLNPQNIRKLEPS